MKQRVTALMIALLLMSGSAFAQGQIPSVYQQGYMGLGGGSAFYYLHNICGDIITGSPRQCLGLVAPGAKTIVSSIKNGAYNDEPTKKVHNLYPNGFMKRTDDGGMNSCIYNYDKQWKLQNFVREQGDSKSVYKYMYDQKHRLVKCLSDGDEYEYKYDANNNLIEIVRKRSETISERFFFKDNKLIKYTEADVSVTFSYDEKGRWKGYINIQPEYDETTSKTQVTFNYTENNPYPTSISSRTGEYNPTKKAYVGQSYVTNFKCTYVFDSKGNWTTWKVSKVSGGDSPEPFTITRTITYYSEEEVKAALTELEQVKKGTPDKEQKKEDLWEF